MNIEQHLIEVCIKRSSNGMVPTGWFDMPIELYDNEFVYSSNAKKFQDLTNWELGKMNSNYRILVKVEDRKYKMRFVNTYYLGGMEYFEQLNKRVHK